MNSNNRLLTNKDLTEDVFSGFINDKKRIQYMSEKYGRMNLSKSFEIFYGEEVPQKTKANNAINQVTTIELGKTYSGTVVEFNKKQMSFSVPGVKEEIICKENFLNCMDEVNNYLLGHNNKLIFEVREQKNNTFYVSVINAYYKKWVQSINHAIQNEDGINVHIDELVKGGYVCHTQITPLVQLTGKNYTQSVFIPGSHIVLNIERDFNKWIGEDVVIIPQNFVEFRKNMITGETETSLVGSRKRVLQIQGMNNMYYLWQQHQLSKAEGANVILEPLEGIVTGIINSSNKTGIFIELEGKSITGLAPIDSANILDYKPGDHVKVNIKEFEVQEGKEAFVLNKKDKLVRCNARPVFEIAM